MWKLYAAKSKGVGICSSPNRINAAFRPFRLDPNYGPEDLWGGQVRYVDLLQVRLDVSMLHRFFYKHRAFEWEREFRLAISVRSAEEYGVRVSELGIEVAVDLDTLIDHIVLGPALSDGDRDRIAQHAKRGGLAKAACRLDPSWSPCAMFDRQIRAPPPHHQWTRGSGCVHRN